VSEGVPVPRGWVEPLVTVGVGDSFLEEVGDAGFFDLGGCPSAA